MDALGISPHQKTDPAIVREVLREMHLEDFHTRFAPMRRFLRNATTKKQDLAPMLHCIREALEKRHPAIVEFTDVALKKGWLKPGPKVMRALHVGYVMEAFTAAMSNNRRFLLEVSDHLSSAAKPYGIDCHHFLSTLSAAFGKTHSFFETAKGLSLDPLMTYYRLGKGLGDRTFSPKKIRQMYADHSINFLERELLMPSKDGSSHHFSDWVGVNIYEAGITDHVHGFAANAACAEALNEDMKNKRYPETMYATKVLPGHCDLPFNASIARTKRKFPSIGFSPEWVRLYISWNAAFVTGTIDELDIVLPKLFIPSVIVCDPSNFIGVRVISLWLTIAHCCFRSFERKSDVCIAKGKRKRMAEAWGAINKKYAQELLREDVKRQPSELQKNSDRFYAHPFWHLGQNVMSSWT